MTERSDAPLSESPDEWYEREKAAFIAWWESGKREKFSENPTIAAGAGWLARAEAVRSERLPSDEPTYNNGLEAAANVCDSLGHKRDAAQEFDAAHECYRCGEFIRALKNAAPQGGQTVTKSDAQASPAGGPVEAATPNTAKD